MAIAAMRVPTVFTAIDRFSSVVSRMSASTTAFGNTAQAAAMRSSRSFNSAGNKMLIAGAGIASGLGLAVNESVNFEKKMANINTLLLLSNDGISKMGDEVLNMAKKSSTPIDQLTTSLYDLISAGVKQQDAFKYLGDSDVLSRTALGTLPEATDAMLASMRNFSSDFKDTNDAANVLFKTVKYGKTTLSTLAEAYAKNAVSASLAGVKGQEFNAMIAAMSITTLPLSELENMIGNLSIALNKGKGKLPEIFKDQGVKNAKELLAKSGSFKAMLDNIDKSASKLGLNVNKVFPLKGASVGFALLTKNKLVIDKYKESLMSMNDKSENAIASADELIKKTTAFKFDQLKNNVKTLSITIGNALIPRVKELVDSITPNIEALANWSRENKSLVSTLMSIAKWLFILGIIAKVGAFLFYGLGRILAFVTFVSNAYAFATEFVAAAQLAQAVSGMSLSAVMWELSLSLLAVYWPVLLIVGVLGLLTYAMVSSIDSTDSMVNNQMASLNKGNQAWVNSTNVMAKELGKQKKLTEFNTSASKLNPISATNVLSSISKRKEEKAAKISSMPKMVELIPMQKIYNDDASPIIRHTYNQDKETPKNIAGQNDVNSKLIDLINSNKEYKQKLDLNITAPEGYGVEALNKPEGIQVLTRPNQGTR